MSDSIQAYLDDKAREEALARRFNRLKQEQSTMSDGKKKWAEAIEEMAEEAAQEAMIDTLPGYKDYAADDEGKEDPARRSIADEIDDEVFRQLIEDQAPVPVDIYTPLGIIQELTEDYDAAFAMAHEACATGMVMKGNICYRVLKVRVGA